MQKIAICDDERAFLAKMEAMLTAELAKNDVGDFEIDMFTSAAELLALEESLSKYSIMFLDINMEEMDGLELAGRIRTYDPDLFIVFVTAFIDYAPEGYKHGALRYILKDMLDVMLPECIEAILRRLRLLSGRIVLPFLEGQTEISLGKLYYIESRKHKLYFHIPNHGDGRLSMYGKLDDIEEQVKDYGFLRIHKSYLVNMQYIVKVSAYEALLTGGDTLPIPRERYKAVRDRLFEYWSDLI